MKAIDNQIKAVQLARVIVSDMIRKVVNGEKNDYLRNLNNDLLSASETLIKLGKMVDELEIEEDGKK